MEKNKSTGVGVASLVLGIFSIVFCWFPFVGLGAGIVGLVCACRENPRSGIATGGLVTSIIGMVFSALYLVFWILVGAVLSAF